MFLGLLLLKPPGGVLFGGGPFWTVFQPLGASVFGSSLSAREPCANLSNLKQHITSRSQKKKEEEKKGFSVNILNIINGVFKEYFHCPRRFAVSGA